MSKLEKQPKVSARDIEEKAIKEKLDSLGFKFVEIPSDGNCLYNAICQQMERLKFEKVKSSEELRKDVSTFLLRNKDKFFSFVEVSTDEEYSQYCTRVRDTNQWGGHVELQVISDLLKKPIVVYSQQESDFIVGEHFLEEDDQPLRVSFHKFFNTSGEHYNSVTNK